MPHLNERQLRLAAALEARSLGYGGVSAVAQATGIARGTIHRGLEELRHPPVTPALEQVRGPGGGRKPMVAQNPRILSRDVSQGLIFAGSDGAEPAWGVVFRQAVVLEAVQRLRGRTFSAPKLDLEHSSASLLVRPRWKSLFG
ncbi:MAG: hypothetical protein ACYCOR_20865 [Acidobacteriaceae bacterium]